MLIYVTSREKFSMGKRDVVRFYKLFFYRAIRVNYHESSWTFNVPHGTKNKKRRMRLKDAIAFVQKRGNTKNV